MNLRHHLSQIALVVGAVLLSIGVQAFAFTQPSTSPPNGDASAPLDTSATAQAKTGGLLVNTGGAANGLIVQSGNVGIGTNSPGSKLEVNGNITQDGSQMNIAGGGDSTYNVVGRQAIGRYSGWDPNMLYLDGYNGFASGVSIGSPGAPGVPFHVYGGASTFGGSVTSPQFCIGGSCITSWPSSSGGNAATITNGSYNMAFHWSGQGGQPTWLWGSNDGQNNYVWNPSNFSVNYANSAGSLSNMNISQFNNNSGYIANGGTFGSGPYTNDWFRVNGGGGIYWQSYGGGWYMQDSTWIRSYNNKPVYMSAGFDTGAASAVGCGGGLGAGYTFRTCGSIDATSGVYDRGNLVYSAANVPGVATFPNNAGYITSGSLSSYLPLSGGTLSGTITVNGPSTNWAGIFNAAGPYGIYVHNSYGYYTYLDYSSYALYSNGSIYTGGSISGTGVYDQGYRVYSPINPPAASTIACNWTGWVTPTLTNPNGECAYISYKCDGTKIVSMQVANGNIAGCVKSTNINGGY